MIRSILVFAMLFAATQCGAESLQVTASPASVQAKHGVPVVMSVNLKNVLTPREPVTITAEAEWEDEYGTARSTTASTTVAIVQPVKVNRYKVVIPAPFDSAQDMLFAFVAGSAKIDGQPATPALDAGRLTFELGRTLSEGESVTLEYSVKAL
jgi:hypothetical protein